MLDRSHPQGARAYAEPPHHIEHTDDSGAPRYAVARKPSAPVAPRTYYLVLAFCLLSVVGVYLAIFSYVNGLIANLP